MSASHREGRWRRVRRIFVKLALLSVPSPLVLALLAEIVLRTVLPAAQVPRSAYCDEHDVVKYDPGAGLDFHWIAYGHRVAARAIAGAIGTSRP